MRAQTVPPHRVAIVGGGFAGLHAARRLGRSGFEVTLLDKRNFHLFQPLLYQVATGALSPGNIAMPQRVVLRRWPNVRCLTATAYDLDPQRKRLYHEHGELDFDSLIVATGVKHSYFGREQWREFAPGLKTVEHAIEIRRKLFRAFELAEHESDPALRRALLSFVVVGAGPTGVELAGAIGELCHKTMVRDFRRVDPREARILLVEGAEDVLPAYPDKLRRAARRQLESLGVDVRTGLRVTSVGATWIAAGDVQLPADAVLWTTNAAAPAWLAAADVDTDQDGFLCVNAHLASTSHADVFGAGDAVTLTHAPRPRSGVFAVRAGRALSANLRLAALQRPLRRWRPQYRFLSIVSTGGRHAVASRGSWSAEGAWVWHWKDWIDRRFMRRFQELPAAMNDAPVGEGIALPDAADQPQMRCGGCGAKLGAQLLDRVLARLDLEHTAVGSGRVQLGVNARDDAAVISPGRAQLAVTVDGFRSFISDPYVFGRLAAVHALGDIYAMGAQPEGVLALATVPHAAEALMADDLYQMMAGGLSALTEAGTPLLGGHSAEGAELSLAFTALGRVVGEAAVTKAGMRAGDVLILTQALGTGVLFAAAGVGRARSRWLTAAIDEMQRLPASAAEICVAHGVGAMTDVTGFGLLGHVAEVSRASGRQVDLYLDRIPALDGALECLCAGLASSLQDNNRQVLGDFELVGVAAGDPRVELLVDPQTCGGLLASVPDQQADACVAALQAAGYRSACVIGRARGHAARTGESGRIVGSVQPV